MRISGASVACLLFQQKVRGWRCKEKEIRVHALPWSPEKIVQMNTGWAVDTDCFLLTLVERLQAVAKSGAVKSYTSAESSARAHLSKLFIICFGPFSPSARRSSKQTEEGWRFFSEGQKKPCSKVAAGYFAFSTTHRVSTNLDACWVWIGCSSGSRVYRTV